MVIHVQKAIPECKGNDGAGLSLTHGYRNSLVLIHQIVLVWVTNIPKKKEEKDFYQVENKKQ